MGFRSDSRFRGMTRRREFVEIENSFLALPTLDEKRGCYPAIAAIVRTGAERRTTVRHLALIKDAALIAAAGRSGVAIAA